MKTLLKGWVLSLNSLFHFWNHSDHLYSNMWKFGTILLGSFCLSMSFSADVLLRSTKQNSLKQNSLKVDFNMI